MTLREVADMGYCVEEWERWQQGQCGTYAHALLALDPTLRMGVFGLSEKGGGDATEGWRLAHVFAHDDTHAYDSAGKHPLPYHGVHNEDDYHEHDIDPDDWGFLSEEGSDDSDVAAAQDHARRNGILEGRYALNEEGTT